MALDLRYLEAAPVASFASHERGDDQSLIVLQTTYEGRRDPVVEPDLVRWLLVDARRLRRDAILVDELGWRLVGAGVPVWRMTLHVGTLHPQILGFAWRWSRETGRTEVLRISHGTRTSEDFLKSPIKSVIGEGKTVRYRLERGEGIADYPLLADVARAGGTDYFATPLHLSGERYPTVTWSTDRAGGFSEADTAFLCSITPALSAVVDARSMRRVAGHLLETYLGRQIGRRILEGQVIRAVGERLRAAILCADLRGFTGLSDRLPGDELIELLDDYFEAVADPVHDRGGDVLKFVGDGVLAIFTVEEQGEAEAALTALEAAERAFANLARVNASRAAHGKQVLRMGIGLHLGEVIYGNVGAASRLDFTAIGPAVNLACRLETLTKRYERPLIMSRDFSSALPRPVVSLGFQPVKGIASPEEVFGVPQLASYEPLEPRNAGH
jgi:adenylate cyclase